MHASCNEIFMGESPVPGIRPQGADGSRILGFPWADRLYRLPNADAGGDSASLDAGSNPGTATPRIDASSSSIGWAARRAIPR